ncbi:MAG: homoaconitase [Phycisphaerae bacterium]|nr:homoaconitase [Phycisphaerae bacterium]MBT5583670.1 homoaconitase [Phycisphaerae bacterium]
MSQTLVEKIATAHTLGGEPVFAGDYLRIRPKHIMTHDNTSAVMGKFKAIGATRMHDASQPVFAIDHDIQNHSPENLGKYAKIEAFASEQGVDFYRPGTGISHQVMIERGYVTPGSMVVGSDSHSNIYGAISALGTPVVRTDAASIWATGETWWQVPPVAQVELTGTLQDGVTGKDVIIALCGAFNHDEVLNHAVEFVGEGIAQLTMDQRMSIANMTTEWGALAGVFPCDEVLLTWLEDRAKWMAARGFPRYSAEDVSDWAGNPLAADADATYAVGLSLDLGSVIPHVSGPDHVKVMHALPEIEAKRIAIQKAYVLSCVNGRLEDLQAAAAVVKGQHVADGVEFYVAAASATIQAEAESDGTWGILADAGVIFLPPGCGTCIGLGAGTLEPGEVGISATNRNFKGRMGSRDAKAYLASPAVVAASALAGHIAAPRTYECCEVRTQFTQHKSSSRKGGGGVIDGFPASITGRMLWLPVDNLNTDGIYSGAMTYRDDVSREDMAAAAMENYDPTFTTIAKPGDIIVSGLNFGTGSSREQAATCLKVRGIACVIAESFSQTYVRNAINNGFICLVCPSLVAAVRTQFSGESASTVVLGELSLNFELATATLGGESYAFMPLGQVPQEIIVAGGAENVVAERLAASS